MECRGNFYGSIRIVARASASRIARIAALCQHHAHRLKSSVEGVENEAKDFQCDNAEERLVTGFTEDNWRVAVSLRQANVAFRNLPLDHGSVRERAAERPFGDESDG